VSDPSTDAPQYFVEEMGEGQNWQDCDGDRPRDPLCLTPRYRVTVRSQQDGRASVLLQTVFAGK
jgi:type IV pilus assembly protein PilX